MLEALTVVTPEWRHLGVAVLVVVVGSYIVAELAARATRLLLVRASDGDRAVRFMGPIVRTPIRATRAVVFSIGLLLSVRPVMALTGATLPGDLVNGPSLQWLLSSGPKVLLVGLVAYVLVRVASLTTERWEARLSGSNAFDEVERAKRARTIGSLARNVVVAAVVSMAGLTIMREVGLDVVPLVTGAGILGLAVGFGAQTLVRDVISGFFLIFENHLRVGDVAVIDGTGGVVEAISLRTTTIRDLEGTVHVFPNGSFERFSNRTKDFSYYVIDVGVAYKEDTDRVSDVLREVGEELGQDPKLSQVILSPLEILGVDAFEDSQVTIKTRIKTVPLKQWDVGRELRRRIKYAFDREGIEIPFPHMSVYVGEVSRPWRVEASVAAQQRAAAGDTVAGGRRAREET